MDWILLVALIIIWGVVLLPRGQRGSPRDSIARFEQGMETLAHTNGAPPGRWVLAPKKDEPFIGSQQRVRMRVRERRRQVLTVLGEAIAITGLIGMVPPLRPMWVLTGALLLLGAAYVFMLLQLRAGHSLGMQSQTQVQQAHEGPVETPAAAALRVRRDTGVVVLIPEAEPEHAYPHASGH